MNLRLIGEPAEVTAFGRVQCMRFAVAHVRGLYLVRRGAGPAMEPPTCSSRRDAR
ncbi:hypothetical protein ACWEN6_19785 [Sphaerisporangium sp. NPDC004334]